MGTAFNYNTPFNFFPTPIKVELNNHSNTSPQNV